MTADKISLLALPQVLDRAGQCEGSGQWAEAEALYRKVLAAFPNHSQALEQLGATLMRTRRFEEALGYLDQSLAIDRTSHRAHEYRGLVLEELGREGDAIASYRYAAMLQPDSGRAAHNLKRLLGQMGRYGTGPVVPGPGRLRILAITVAPDWWSIARLPSQLMAAGFDVAVFCPMGSYLSLTRFTCQRYFRGGENIGAELGDAVAAWNPHLIVPGDEFAVHLLHHMERLDLPEPLRRLFRRSCGDPRFYGVVSDKRRTLEAAAGLGIVHPAQAPISDMQSFSDQYGYPLLVKMTTGMAGLTVRACADAKSAAAAIAELQSLRLPPYLSPPSLIVQRHIEGRLASVAFVALDGHVLDSFVYRPLETLVDRGPSSVIGLMDHPEIDGIARRLVAHFGFSGFGGFDFIVEDGTGALHLLEMNPRVTLASYLGRAFGHDLSGALHAALTGGEPPPVTRGHETVAIFPHEWWRDTGSPYLKRHFADIPWDDPDLLDHVLSSPNPQNAQEQS